MPAISERNRLIGRAELQVDGRKVPVGRGDGPIAIARADARSIVSGREPGDAFQKLLVRAPAPTPNPPRVIVVAETSAAMTAADRVRQRAAIEALMRALPAGARLTLLAADWDATAIAEDAEAPAWPDALAKIDRIVSAGGLHLERALRVAAERAKALKSDAVLFVGRARDGFAGEALDAPMAALRDARARLSIVAVGADDLPPSVALAAVRSGGVTIVARAFTDTLPALVEALRPLPAPPTVDARGAGDWYTLPTITGELIWIGRALEAPRSADGDKAAGAGEQIGRASCRERVLTDV